MRREKVASPRSGSATAREHASHPPLRFSSTATSSLDATHRSFSTFAAPAGRKVLAVLGISDGVHVAASVTTERVQERVRRRAVDKDTVSHRRDQLLAVVADVDAPHMRLGVVALWDLIGPDKVDPHLGTRWGPVRWEGRGPRSGRWILPF